MTFQAFGRYPFLAQLVVLAPFKKVLGLAGRADGDCRADGFPFRIAEKQHDITD